MKSNCLLFKAYIASMILGDFTKKPPHMRIAHAGVLTVVCCGAVWRGAVRCGVVWCGATQARTHAHRHAPTRTNAH